MKLYPLASEYTYRNPTPLPEGVSRHDFAYWKDGERVRLMAKTTGAKRRPRAGEWFISGAVHEAYYAPSDLDGEYMIAVLVPTRSRVIIEEV